MFKDFSYHKCESLKRIKEELQVFKNIEITSTTEALNLSTKLPSVSPRDFLEEVSGYWDKEQVPLLESEKDRFVMAQIHSMVLNTYTRYLMEESLNSKLWKYWSDTYWELSQAFCESFISSGKLDMTYSDLRHRDPQRVALGICLGHSKPSDYLRIGFIGLDLETIQRATASACCGFDHSLGEDHEDQFYTEGMVNFIEKIRCKLRRRVLI